MLKNILLIGGNGFIGQKIASKLPEGSFKILTRQNKKQESFIKGDLLDLNSLIQALEDTEYIIQSAQFAGHPVERPWLGSEYTYEGLDARGTENIVKAIHYAGKQGRIKQFIYLSGAGAGADLSNNNFPWLRAKKRAEKAISESGIPFTIFRPSWVYGQGDISMSKFIFFAKYLPFFPVIGDGNAPVNPVLVDDLAQIIVNSMNQEKAFNQIFEVGSPELKMKQVAKIVLQSVNKQKPLLYHPKPLLKLIGLFSQFLPFSPISPSSVDFLTMDVHLNNLQSELFGIKIKNLEEGLEQSLV